MDIRTTHRKGDIDDPPLELREKVVPLLAVIETKIPPDQRPTPTKHRRDIKKIEPVFCEIGLAFGVVPDTEPVSSDNVCTYNCLHN